LPGGVATGQHISKVSNASRALLLNIRTLEWDPVTAFSGLLAPYWDPGATGLLLLGLTSYTTPAHIARGTLEADAFRGDR